MSLQVLKRKSRRFQAPISGRGRTGFSLVGTHRNIGVVGITNLGKSVKRTPFRGNEPMGSGGCCGTYTRVISNSGSCCTNDNSIVKKTVKNNAGMIDTKYQWTKSQYPNYWVQQGASLPGNTTQGLYIKNIIHANSACVTDKTDTGIKPCNGGKCTYFIGSKKYIRMPYSKNLQPFPTSSSEYQRGELMKKECLPSPASKAPFPMYLVRNGCDVNYLTVQEAIADGVLPADHVDA